MRNKKYREQNIEMIKHWQSIKFECECGVSCLLPNKARHIKSPAHQLYLESLDTKTNEIKPNDNI